MINGDRIVRLHAQGGHLVMQSPFLEDAELLAVSPTTFVRTDNATRYTFTRTADGVEMRLDPPDEWPVCKRLAPGQTVALDEVAAGHIEAAAARYRASRAKATGDAAFAFSEERLNRIGVTMILRGDPAAALLPLRVNVVLSPDSMNAYDSLAEAYMRSGDRKRAIETFRQSLAAFARDKKTPLFERNLLRDNARKRLQALQSVGR
jgi:tetratricopeptide (TPR) repeat protein